MSAESETDQWAAYGRFINSVIINGDPYPVSFVDWWVLEERLRGEQLALDGSETAPGTL